MKPIVQAVVIPVLGFGPAIGQHSFDGGEWRLSLLPDCRGRGTYHPL